MAFILKDRVKESTTTTGTGNISLGGALATFDTFQTYLSNGDTTFYAIAHTSSGVDEWEVGLGTWNTGNTLTRTTVLAGSNSTSAVTFSAGTKDVFMTYPASKAIVSGEDAAFANITVTGTVDGRDIAADGTKLDGVEASADVTDTANVTSAGALMRSGGTMTGSLVLNANPSAALGAATKQYVDTEVSSLVDSAPSTLDTLNELAAALGDDANFSTTVTNSIATKLPLAGGTLTGNLGINKSLNSAVSLSVKANTTATNSYGLEVTNASSNTRFLVDGVGNSFFYKTDNSVGMKFDSSSGDIGVGTQSPAGTLHLHSADTALRLTSSQGSNTPLAQLQYSSSGGYFLRLGDSANNEDVMIRSYGDSYFKGGNVGIGTSSPNSYAGYTVLTVNNATNGGVVEISQNNTIKGQFYYDGTQTRLRSNVSTALAFDTNNTERMRLTSAGALLLNTATHTPTDTELVVSSEYSASGTTDAGITLSARQSGNWRNSGIFANGDALTFTTGDTGINGAISTSEKMRISSAGLVGIGTSSPSDKFHVDGAGAFIRVNRTDGEAGITLMYNGSNSTRSNISTLTNGDLQFETANTERMRIDASGNVVVGGTSAQASDAATLMADGEVTAAGFYFSNNIGSAMNDTGIRRATTSTMVFDTASTERMRIDSNGRVMIAETSNSGYSNNADDLIVGDNGSSTERGISLGSTLASTIRFNDGSDAGTIEYVHSENSMRFGTNNGTERMRIDSSGNIGIGTQSPSNKLEINSSNGSWRSSDYGGMYFQNTSDANHEVYIHSRSDGKISIGRVPIASLTGGSGGYAANSYDHLNIDTAGKAVFSGDVQAAGLYVGATNTSYDFYNNGTTYLNGATTIDANTQINGNLTLEDGQLYVGNVSADNWTRVRHIEADGYGFDTQHNNATVIVNEQGSTNQALVLGDVDAGDYTGLFGIAHSTDTGSNWTKKLDLRGNGELYIGSSGTSRVFHDGYHPNANAWTTSRTLSLTGDATGSVSIDGSSNVSLSVSVGDADTVDGVHASSIFYDKGANQLTTSSSWDVTTTGMYGVGSGSAFSGTNNPSSAISGIYTYGVLNVFEANGNGIAQLYTPHTGNKIAIRTGWNNGSWYPWQQVWTSTSDGSGSGLDADLLDGYHGSNYIGKNGNSYYQPNTYIDFNTSNSGLYWSGGSATGWHIFPADTSDMQFMSGNTNVALRFKISGGATKGYVYANSSSEIGFLNDNRNWSLKVDNSGNTFATASHRAPIFYDSNNTAYYVDPSSNSSMYGISIRGDVSSTGTANQIFLWTNSATTTSAIGFKSSGGQFASPTGNGDGYNTYLTMDTVGRGWVFRRGTGGGDFTAAYTSGWILNNGHWTATASMRAPIFYDYNDTNYYVDPATLSRVYRIMAGGTIDSTPNGTQFSNVLGAVTVGGQSGRACYFDGGGVGASVWWGNGNSPYGAIDSDQANGLRFYYNNSSGTWSEQFRVSDGYTYAINQSRAPIFYDSDNTAYYVNPASGSILSGDVVINQAAVSYTSGDNTRLTGSYTSNRLHVNGSIQLTNNGDALVIGRGTSTFLTDEELGFGWGSGWYQTDATYLRVRNNKSVYSTSDARFSVYYDSNDTAYYTDPTSESRMARLHVGDGSNYIRIGDEGEGANTSYSRIRTNSSGDLFLDAKGSQNIYLGWWSSTASRVYSEMGAQFPVYYDRNNTAYYVDGASTSNFAVANFAEINVDGGTRNNSNDATLYITATNNNDWGLLVNKYNASSSEYGVDIRMGSSFSYGLRVTGAGSTISGISSSQLYHNYSVRGPIFYDSGNTAYYFDGSATGDSIRVAGNIVAYYSDERLKNIEGNIDSPLEKVSQLNGFYYKANKKAQTLGYKDNRQVGVSAQQVEAVMPEVVTDAAIGYGYKTVDYAKLVPLLIEAVKEQQDQIETLKSRLEKLEN